MEQLRGSAAQLCIVTGTLTALTSAIGRFVSDPSRLAETSDDPAAVINGVVALIASLLLVFVLLALYGEHREPRGGHRLGPVALKVALVARCCLQETSGSRRSWCRIWPTSRPPRLVAILAARCSSVPCRHSSYLRSGGCSSGSRLIGWVAATGAADPGDCGGRAWCAARRSREDSLRHRARLARIIHTPALLLVTRQSATVLPPQSPASATSCRVVRRQR